MLMSPYTMQKRKTMICPGVAERRAAGETIFRHSSHRQRGADPENAKPGEEQARGSPERWLAQPDCSNSAEMITRRERRDPDGAALRQRIAPQWEPENILEETPESLPRM